MTFTNKNYTFINVCKKFQNVIRFSPFHQFFFIDFKQNELNTFVYNAALKKNLIKKGGGERANVQIVLLADWEN